MDGNSNIIHQLVQERADYQAKTGLSGIAYWMFLHPPI